MSAKSRERRERFLKVLEARQIDDIVKNSLLFDAVKRYTNLADNPTAIDEAVVIDIQTTDNGLPEEPRLISETIRPPFLSTFLEWRPQSYSGSRSIRVGVLATWHDGDRNSYLAQSQYSAIHDYPNLMCCDVFIERQLKPPFYIGNMILGVGDDGRLPANGDRLISKAIGGSLPRQATDQDVATMIEGFVPTALHALEVINCRNITLVDHDPDPTNSAAYERHFGAPLTKYKTLAIKSMGKSSATDTPQQQFDVMPLHLRRGNFAHYSDDAPLFGKYTGTFWRPATVVGSEKNGVVAKDYQVIEPAHKAGF